MRAYGQLLRLSLTASALADAAAGLLVGARGWPAGSAPWLVLAASASVYHGGMALNDWADRQVDATVPARSARPLASGAVAASTALAIAVVLLVLGPVLAASVALPSALVLAAVGVTAVLYDLIGRGPWLGPFLLGLCRAGNLGAALLAGHLLAHAEQDSTAVDLARLAALPLAYGAYVFLVSRLGRLEDAEDAIGDRRVSPGALIVFIALVLLTPALLPTPTGYDSGIVARVAAFTVGAFGAVGLVRAGLARTDWTPNDVLPVMGMALRRLLVFTASVALLTGTTAGWVGAGLILAGFPLSHGLRRVFPPS